MAWPFTAAETVLIITTTGGAITAMIAAIRASKAQEVAYTVKQQTGVIEHKMDIVSHHTNSQLTRLEEKLSAAEGREASLFAALQQAELARRDLASSTAENTRMLTEKAAVAAADAAAVIAAAMDRAHTQASQQAATPAVLSGADALKVESVTVKNEETEPRRIILP